MPKLLKILAIVAAVLVVLHLAKNHIVQTVIAGSISHAAHLPVRIGSTNLSLLASSIQLKNIRVENPKGFPEKAMLDAPEVAIDLEPADLFKNQAHFKEVRLNIRELVVVKDASGRLNVDAVKPSQTERDAQKARSADRGDASARKGPAPKLRIDKLTLTIGRVVFHDYSGGGAKPAEQVFDINVRDRVYTNIEDPSAIISLIMFEALTRTTLVRLVNLDVGVFKDGAAGALSEGLGLVADSAEGLEKEAKNLLGLFS